ncbi:MAG: AgmX/PglI C-terminal domain-containing protein [Proteobacteria bacterium]|nr:AgmX/PglI C-terminal domain-containing protein [Pseudomonadota bacterium]
MATTNDASRKQGEAPVEAKILRIGVIQAGKIVEERLVRRRGPVTIGASARNTIVVPASSLPRSYTLFEHSGDHYQLVFGESMDGRVSVGGQVQSLDQLRQGGSAQTKGKALHRLLLDESSRGKVMLGEVTLLFQFVAPPPFQPRPQLPPSVRGSILGQMDWLLAWSFLGTAAVVSAFIVQLHTMDTDRRISADVIPDDFAEYVPTMEQPRVAAIDLQKLGDVGEEKVEKVEGQSAGAKKARGPKREAPPCDEACQGAREAARRARLAEQVAQMGALKILGAKGGSGSGMADLLHGGDPGTAADKAFRNIGGLTVAGRGGGGLRGKGDGGSGRAVGIGDLGGRVGGPGAVDTGGVVEERVPKAIVKPAGAIERDATLEADAVARTIRLGMQAIKGCYQRALKRNPRLTGKIGIRLTISATGSVAGVEIETDTLGDSQVTSCIEGFARRWRFPPPDGGGTAEVAVPFVFQAAE